MGLIMNGEFEQMIEDTKEELKSICKWINSGNQFDSKTRFLVSYAVIKTSGTVEVIFKNMIYSFLANGANDKTKSYLEKAIIDSSCNPNTGNMSICCRISLLIGRHSLTSKLSKAGKKIN